MCVCAVCTRSFKNSHFSHVSPFVNSMRKNSPDINHVSRLAAIQSPYHILSHCTKIAMIRWIIILARFVCWQQAHTQHRPWIHASLRSSSICGGKKMWRKQNRCKAIEMENIVFIYACTMHDVSMYLRNCDKMQRKKIRKRRSTGYFIEVFRSHHAHELMGNCIFRSDRWSRIRVCGMCVLSISQASERSAYASNPVMSK